MDQQTGWAAAEYKWCNHTKNRLYSQDFFIRTCTARCVFFFPWIHTLVFVSAVSNVRVHVMFVSIYSKKTFSFNLFSSPDHCFVDIVDWQTENMTWQTKASVSKILSGSCSNPETACTFIFCWCHYFLLIKCQVSAKALSIDQTYFQSTSDH